MGQGKARLRHLPFPRFAAQLLHRLDDLRHAGRAEGMPFGEQPAAGAHLHARPRQALLDEATAFAARAQPEVFVVDDLGNGEAVMDFGAIELVGPDAGLLVRRAHGARVDGRDASQGVVAGERRVRL